MCCKLLHRRLTWNAQSHFLEEISLGDHLFWVPRQFVLEVVERACREKSENNRLRVLAAAGPHLLPAQSISTCNQLGSAGTWTGEPLTQTFDVLVGRVRHIYLQIQLRQLAGRQRASRLALK